jgi:D-amino-acid dehydrogenase
MTEEGCLAIYETEAEFAADRGHIALMQRYGFEHKVLLGAEIRDYEPALSPKIAKAVLLPDNKSIRDPYRLVLRLVEAAKALGMSMVTGEVRNVERLPDGSISVALSDGRRVDAAQVVLAAGVRTRFIAKTLGEPIPLETERGYHTQIMRPGISMRYSIIWPHRAFMVTPTAGGIRVGGNVELAGLDAPPEYRRPRVLVRHAQRALPGLKVEEATDWMGHRPALPDTIPIISPSSRIAGVWYATGHGHLGLTLSATTARLLADMMAGIVPLVDMNPFRIDRY